MKKVEKFQELKEALDNDKKVYLKDDHVHCHFNKDFWLLCPLIMIFRSIQKGEIYVEE